MEHETTTLERLLLNFGKAMRTAQEINDALVEAVLQKEAEVAVLRKALEMTQASQKVDAGPMAAVGKRGT